MNRQKSTAYEELGACQRGRTDQKPQPVNRTPRPVPTIDPEIINGHHPNDFDRWFEEQQKNKGNR